MVLLSLIACGWTPTQEGLGEVEPMMGVDERGPNPLAPPPVEREREVDHAVVEITGLSTSVTGEIKFEPSDQHMAISGSIAGLEPGSVHAIHVHQGYTCGPDGKAAGSHFAPAAHPHGRPGDKASHAGDLGNITAGPNGVATLSLERDDLSLDGDNSVVARTLVVHAKEDQFEGKAGKPGPRVACGVILTKTAG